MARTLTPHVALRTQRGFSIVADVKTEVRRHALAKRDLVTHQEAQAAAAALSHAGLALVAEIAASPGVSAPVVAVYWPIRSELNTRPLIDALADRGYRVTLPVMRKVRFPLVFRDFSPGDDLVKGPYGLSEPAADRPARDPDIVFSPLSAFDRRGYRLGYGGGIYDATLSELRAKKTIVAIGVGYSFQEVDHVPAEPHDQRLDYFLTERERIEIA